MNENHVTIFTEENYKGQCSKLVPGFYDSKHLGIPEKTLTSLRIPENFQVTLFDGDYIHTRSHKKTFTTDTKYVGDDFKNLTLTVLVEKLDRVVIFESLYFLGKSSTLKPGLYDAAHLGIPEHSLTSLLVPNGLCATIYQNYYQAPFAKHKTFTKNTDYVGTYYDNITSAILVEKTDNVQKI